MIVKICGLRRQEDAELALALGADLLGFVGEPSSPRYVGEGWGPDWLMKLPVPRVAVYGVARQASPVFTHVQAHTWPVDWDDPRPRLSVWRLGDPAGEPAMEGAYRVLDAYHPQHHGGLGQRIDWDEAARIVAASATPVVLAGGLDADNVAEAIRRVRPAGVDVSSGTEKAPGIKDPERLKAFIENARSAF